MVDESPIFIRGVKIERLFDKCPHDNVAYVTHVDQNFQTDDDFLEFVNYTTWLTVMGLLETREMIYGR